MKLIVLLFTGLFFTTGLVNAQTDFRPAYLVKNNGDTLRGEIDYRGDILMGELCRFRLENSDKTETYSPDDIIEFKFNESKYFISKQVKGKNIFLEFLIKGKVNIYSHKDQRGEHFFIEKTGLGLSELTYEEGVTYKDNTPIEYKSTTHIGLLNMYMQDAPEFQSRIAKMDKPKQRWLIELAEDYHNRVCKDEKCLIFEKKLPLLVVNLEIVAGFNIHKGNGSDDFYYYMLEDDRASQNSLQFGVLANFWLPRVNEKLYLRTGILYSTFTAYDESKKYYKIPIQAEYIYPKGIVRPKLAYGINLYKPFNYTVAIMPGINFQLSKSINFEINANFDLIANNKFPLIPDRKVYAYGVISGLYIKLQ